MDATKTMHGANREIRWQWAEAKVKAAKEAAEKANKQAENGKKGK